VDYDFCSEKNAWLIENRGISFEQIIALIEAGKLLQILEHSTQAKYPGQLMYEVKTSTATYMSSPLHRRDPSYSWKLFTRAESDQESEGGKGGVKKREFYDDAEKQLVEAYERDEFKPVKSQKAAKRAAIDAARRYMRKDARINIRLSAADLEMIKRRAVEEGLPYQTLIASILHKYASGSGLTGKKAS